MPLYDYRCKVCGASWEEQLPIAQRDVPTTEECVNPDCPQPRGSVGSVERYLPTAPGFSYTLNDRKHVPSAFKDVLKRIKKAHRHSTIDV